MLLSRKHSLSRAPFSRSLSGFNAVRPQPLDYHIRYPLSPTFFFHVLLMWVLIFYGFWKWVSFISFVGAVSVFLWQFSIFLHIGFFICLGWFCIQRQRSITSICLICNWKWVFCGGLIMLRIWALYVHLCISFADHALDFFCILIVYCWFFYWQFWFRMWSLAVCLCL